MRTILIVEDDQLFRKALTTFLSSLGFETYGVATGEDALREVSWSNVDLVLIDYYLPGNERDRTCPHTAGPSSARPDDPHVRISS